MILTLSLMKLRHVNVFKETEATHFTPASCQQASILKMREHALCISFITGVPNPPAAERSRSAAAWEPGRTAGGERRVHLSLGTAPAGLGGPSCEHPGPGRPSGSCRARTLETCAGTGGCRRTRRRPRCVLPTWGTLCCLPTSCTRSPLRRGPCRSCGRETGLSAQRTGSAIALAHTNAGQLCGSPFSCVLGRQARVLTNKPGRTPTRSRTLPGETTICAAAESAHPQNIAHSQVTVKGRHFSYKTAFPVGGMHVGSVTQLCLTLSDPMDGNPPGSSVHGISRARVLEWVAIPFSGGFFQPRD